jgi:hypothetical protein
MKPRFRPLVFTSLSLFAGATAPAADSVVIPILILKNGRVFHHAKIVNVHSLTLNIVADEGLAQINKSALPPDLAAQYPADAAAAAVEQKAEETSAEVARKLEEERHKQALARQKEAAAELEKKAVLNGCRILSFTQFGPGCALVEVRNETDAPAVLPGKSMLARNSTNQVLSGFWLREAKPDAKRYQGSLSIPGNTTVKLPVLFTLKREITVTDVFWSQS